ncbi:hypothetical protein TU85_06150 [Pseudomonas helleri]|nr:hypothetical protein TU85_06150 [Pseudomonas helleri]
MEKAGMRWIFQAGREFSKYRFVVLRTTQGNKANLRVGWRGNGGHGEPRYVVTLHARKGCTTNGRLEFARL